MQDILNKLTDIIPDGFDFISAAKFILIFAVSVIASGFIFKLLFGKKSDINRALSGAIGILFIYALTIVIYTFDPANLSRFLSPLPYVIFSNDKLYLFVFRGTHYSVICSQGLSMVILAFLYHVLDDFMPEGKGLHWLLYRLLTIVMAMALHYVSTWLCNSFLSAPLLTYAPTVLLVILLSLLLLGVLKLVLGVALTVVNPVLGALYAFFFSSKLGKQLSRAVMTTILLSLLVMLLHSFGHSVISVSIGSLTAYIPLVLILLGLWYFLFHI